MKKLIKPIVYVTLTFWASNGGPIDQEVIDLVFSVWDMVEKAGQDKKP